MTLTRRRFLLGVAAVGGAGAVLGAMEALDLSVGAREGRRPFVPPARSDFELTGRRNDATVLVLGAGVAGLVAAYELEKAGYTCELLEARARPGGRSFTVRAGTRDEEIGEHRQTARFEDGNYLNPGPARIAQHHTTLDYCRELGVPVEVFVNANPQAYAFIEPGGPASGPLAGRPVRRRAAYADTLGYVAELLAKAVNRRALDEELTPEDGERLVELLRGLGALGPGDRYVGSDRRGRRSLPGARAAAEPTEPFDLSDLLASAIGHEFTFDLEWDQAMPMFQPVGGMDRLPYALADAIRGRIRYEAEVREIEAGPERTAVVYRDASGDTLRVEADHCVCTIPPTVLKSIRTNLPDDVKLALQSLQGVPAGKLGLEYGRRFWEEDDGILGGITATNTDIGTILYPSTGYLGRSGVLVGYYNFFGQADEYGRLSPAERERRAVERGRAIHGDAYADELRSSFSVEWSRVRHSLGAWVAWQEHDASNEPAYRRLVEPQGTLWFAGDHLSAATAWQHGAIESARAAVTELHAVALARR